ncbi:MULTISPECIES: hypothetical protein [Aeromonas]|uniref:hypothetical protein n=1 Tax=Aeromonas TaxID=642 RepID=UPI001F38CCC2|nr:MULTISPECIES: hypothetical protein [Aeromonas]MCX4114693.1 hypothetical protein [Aeromonas hydrophila]
MEEDITYGIYKMRTLSMQIIQVIRATTMAILLSCSFTAFTADYALQIESKIPTTLSGKLGYASMNYWIEVPGKENVELDIDADDEEQLINLRDKQVSLEGAMVTYSNGSVYFEPKLDKPQTTFVVQKTDEANFDVLFNGESLTHHDSYDNIKIAHQFVIPDGQVALLELFTGGVGCPVLYQLIVVRQNTPSMISGTFGTCSDLGKLSHDAKGFTLDLPGNPREMWIWDNEHLNVFKKIN